MSGWWFAGPLGAAMLPVEEYGADDGHPHGRDDLLLGVDRRIDNEVEEVLPRRPEDRAVLRIGDFDDDTLAGICLCGLCQLDMPVEVPFGTILDVPEPRPSCDGVHRELAVRARRAVVDPHGGAVQIQWRPVEHG